VAEPWWKTGVLYQIYPRSFADANGDGQGDLRGVIDHLDHLEWLGVAGIWLSPVTPSPNADWGYDVSDYCDIHPDFGTLADLDTLVAEAGRRGMQVLIDLVPNHTSDQHPWFVDARRSRTSRCRDWYVWADPKPDGGLPNNWVSSFGGPAWTLDEETGQYYLHNFLPEQPDLNWWNEEVRDEFDRILRFWFDRGIAGFRIDVAHMIVKDAELRDNPPATEDDPFIVRMFGQRSEYNANQPEVHEVLRRWRKIADSYSPPRILVGETNVDDVETLVSYYGSGENELHLGFNFSFIEAPYEPAGLPSVVEQTEALFPPGAWPVWTGSNHDVSRFPTRWAQGDPAKMRAALVAMVGLWGTVFLYQGDEIGMTDTTLTREDLKDPVGMRFWPYYAGRDPVRTPMAWSADAGGGFTRPGVTPWLPFGDLRAANVADQRDDPASMLRLTKDLLALRQSSPDLGEGERVPMAAPAGVWAWRRGRGTVVTVNLTGEAVSVPVTGISGTILVSSDRSRDGETVSGSLTMAGWEATIVG
jgi:alpha-glucosidase